MNERGRTECSIVSARSWQGDVEENDATDKNAHQWTFSFGLYEGREFLLVLRSRTKRRIAAGSMCGLGVFQLLLRCGKRNRLATANAH